MKTVAALFGVLVGLTMSPASGVEVNGNNLTLTEAERTACREEGGCALVTDAYVRKMLDDARKEGRASCGRMT